MNNLIRYLFFILPVIPWVAFGQTDPEILLHQTDKADFIKVLNIRHEVIQQLRFSRKNIDYPSFFSIKYGSSPSPGSPMIEGRYYLDKREIIFQSQHKLIPGQTYTVKFNLPYLYSIINFPVSSDLGILSVHLEAHEYPPQPPRIIEVYPTADQLPANPLRFHILFSTSMKSNGANSYISLVSPNGEITESSLNETYAWDMEHKILTWSINPGMLGQQDGKYVLKIDSRWSDLAGKHLTGTFIKEFTIGESDREDPDPRNWKIIEPTTERSPLVILFDEPMDYLSLKQSIHILDTYGFPVEGTVNVTGNEREWTFTAHTPWRQGEYIIKVSNEIKDLAGNGIPNKDESLTKENPDTDSTTITFGFKSLH